MSLASILLALAMAVSAGGKVAHVLGKATVSGKPAKAGMALKDGDIVVSKTGATIIIEMADGSLLKLRENTRLTVQADNAAELSLGGVFARVRRAGFSLRTGSAVASVRGTEFFTAYGRSTGKKRKKSDLWLCVNEGVVDVSSLETDGKTEVKAGNGILIPAGKGPTKPQPYDWTKTLNWNMDPAVGGVEDKTSLDAAYSDLLDQDYR